MRSSDIGESLVGAYMRYVEGCPIVLYDSFLSEQQGEVDVVAVKPSQPGATPEVFLCEVTTHIPGLNTKTVTRMRDKLARVREFAEVTFPDEQHRFQWWSPYVATEATTQMFAELCAEWNAAGLSLEFVINGDYTKRVDQLVSSTRGNPSATAEPAYRMPQILTRLRGERPAPVKRALRDPWPT